ncbi:hypothetical protein BC826DRAFT_1088526 [Russula brevipes]|nr:hypothetical protein BC826DRAFT_1088526 [Russula brevipes]
MSRARQPSARRARRPRCEVREQVDKLTAHRAQRERSSQGWNSHGTTLPTVHTICATSASPAPRGPRRLTSPSLTVTAGTTELPALEQSQHDLADDPRDPCGERVARAEWHREVRECVDEEKQAASSSHFIPSSLVM